jgi:hypothetical protein
MSSGTLPASRAISRSLNILRAGNGLYAIVRSSSSPFSSSVRSSRLSILCPSSGALPSEKGRASVDLAFEDVLGGIVAAL